MWRAWRRYLRACGDGNVVEAAHHVAGAFEAQLGGHVEGGGNEHEHAARG